MDSMHDAHPEGYVHLFNCRTPIEHAPLATMGNDPILAADSIYA